MDPGGDLVSRYSGGGLPGHRSDRALFMPPTQVGIKSQVAQSSVGLSRPDEKSGNERQGVESPSIADLSGAKVILCWGSWA